MQSERKGIYIVSAYRSPVGKAKGVFRHKRPDDLLADVIKGTMASLPNLDPALIEDVIIGCAMPEGEQGMNVARIATLLADLPKSVPAMTINRFCSSGLQAIALAADRIQCGEAEAILAGGVESMTRVPMGGFHFRANPKYFEEDHIGIAYSMGITAEKVAARWKIDRESQDQFALISHQHAIQAIEAGDFKNEIIPIRVTETEVDYSSEEVNSSESDPTLHKTENTITVDQGPRKDTSMEALSKLKPVFMQGGTVTAGNSSPMNDGAAIVLVASESFVRQHNLTPIGRYCGFNVAGVPPEIMGIGPVEAVPKVLKKSGIQLADIDWIELNEAFAAQSLAVIRELKFDPKKVNPCGGAIALGHPLGATGAIRTTTLLHGLKRKKLKWGLVTMCVGTGMGGAGLFESI